MSTFSLPKIQHLVVFQEVTHSGSIGAGAKAPGFIQPAVSKAIGDVESYFGSRLIVRRNTDVPSTEVGQVFLNWSEAIIREMGNMINEANALISSAVVDISFGFPLLVGLTPMPEITYQFKTIFPEARVSMYEARLSTFLPVIRDGHLNFAIGMLSDRTKLQDLHVEPLFESESVLVVNQAWIGNGTVRLTSLQCEQWVLSGANMGYYSELLAILQCSGTRRENIVDIDLAVATYNLVLNADFLAVIPCDMTTSFSSNQSVTILIKEVLSVVRCATVWSKNYRLKAVAVLLVEMAKRYSSGQGNHHWQPTETI